MAQEIAVTRAKEWLSYEYDPQTREKVQWLLDNDPKGLEEAFGSEMEFGTGGLRGLMGVGTNRMNIYTVGRATQGLANYLRSIPALANRPLRVAIAHDSRNGSELFAQVAADVLAANGIRVYLYHGVRPTPQLSFTVRMLRCQAGIVITASHNPKEYNGYKVYWSDGAQVVPPHDTAIIEAVTAVRRYEQVQRNGNKNLIVALNEEFDEPYINLLLSGCHRLDVVERWRELPLVYTPIHGAGGKVTPKAIRSMGFTQLQVVTKQRDPDGDFPTVGSPNPEDPQAMQLALELGESVGAELVLANDPDVDRIGVYARDRHGALVRFDGNQIALLLAYYTCYTLQEKGLLPKNGYLVSTVVTSPLMDAIAADFGLKIYHELTGFKWIAARIAEEEGRAVYVAGGEESHGFLVGDGVRDKDGVQACMLFAEMAAWCKDQGGTVPELMGLIYAKYGVMGHGQISLVRKGLEGAKEIAAIMEQFRREPPSTIDGERVVKVADFLDSQLVELPKGKKSKLTQPRSNVLQWITERGATITVRPSGTEPKIKFYASAGASVSGGSLVEAQARVQRLLEVLTAPYRE